VNLYYEMIYDQSAPIIEVAPVEETPTQRPQKAPKKPRRSAVNVALVAELQMTKKVGIAQVRKALSPVCPKDAPECPKDAPIAPQKSIAPCVALGRKFDATGNLKRAS